MPKNSLACFFFTLPIVLGLSLIVNSGAACADNGPPQTSGAGSEADFVTHLNAGVASAKTGKLDDAIIELKKAAAIKPNDQLVLANLGQVYQLSGNNKGALEQYQKYLSLYPKGPHVAQITNMFKAMQTQIMAGGTSSKGKDNYLSEAISPGGVHWNVSDMPIPVYINGGTGVEGYLPEFTDILKQAFADWSAASQGKFSVTYVDNIAKAKIICKWTANVGDLFNPSEGGQAFVQSGVNGTIMKADVTLLTHNANVPASVQPATYMRHICLHELGHALGLAGHSSQAGDIMFSLMNYDSAKSNLSDRDKKTIVMLYSALKTSGTPGAVPIVIPVTPSTVADPSKK